MFRAKPRSQPISQLQLASAALISVLLVPSCSEHTSCPSGPQPGPTIRAVPTPRGRHLVLSDEEIRALPIEGVAWDGLVAYAREPIEDPDLSDQNDRDNLRTLAKAILYIRTGDAKSRLEVIDACTKVIDTQAGSTLPLARELAAYVIAADWVGLPPETDAAFRRFLDRVRRTSLGGKTLISTHESRPNNWGTHAGATRIAIARYLHDDTDLAAAARVFQGWLGDRDSYDAFEYRELSWQADRSAPVGINPLGSTLEGHSVDGCLPDDQRRGGSFVWPPPRENYAYEALQGAVLQAILLDRAGYDVWQWQDRALWRAFRWLETEANFPAEGDDEWQPFVVRHFSGVDSPPTPLPEAERAAQPGKNFGFTDWLYGSP